MAAVHGGVDPPPSAGDAVDVRRWRIALAGGVVLCVAYAALPTRDGTPGNVVYAAGEALAVVAIVAGVLRYRPAAPAAWLLIAAALSAFLAGDLLWTIYEARGEVPFPSAADVFYLAGYPLLAAGLVIGIVRQRAAVIDARAGIDAALLTAIVAFLSWVYVVWPTVNDAALSTLEQTVTVAYPVGDVLLLAVAARFVMRWNWNVRALQVLVLGLTVTLIGDTIYSLAVAEQIGAQTEYWDTALLLGVVLIGLAALHPTMRALTEESGDPTAPSGIVEVVLLGCACLVPVMVLVAQRLREEPLHLAATTFATIVITGLVVARFTVMTTRARRAAEREVALSRFAGELLRSHGTDRLFELAERAASDLLRAGTSRVIVAGETAAPGPHAFSMPVTVGNDVAAEVVADADRVALRRARDSLATVATQLALALEREQLFAQEQEAGKVLAEQNERLRELDRMKDQFVGFVSHELRTPLTSMIGYLELVLDGEAGDLGDEQRRSLEIVNRNCARLSALINDILEVSRIDAGRLSLAPEWVDLGELAETAVELARAGAERNAVTLRIAAHERPHLWADPARLRQLLDNLVSNAVKFTPPGGTVTVTVAAQAEHARLEVSDTGAGIPAEEIGNLFDRFFRASTAESIPGTGLGLSIVKSIVELHGGSIAVESAIGAGTTFSVELPIGVPPPAPTEPEDRYREIAT